MLLNIDKELSQALDQNGAFYAFSKAQFDEKAQPHTKYSNLPSGLLCPSDNASKLLKEFDSIHEKGVKQVLLDKTPRQIIWHELGNYECQIAYNYSDAVDAVKMYGITEADVKAVWPDFIDHCNKHNLY